MEYTILILLLPLASFLVLGLAGMKMRPAAAGAVGTAVLAVVALLSYWTAFEYFSAGRDAAGVFPTLIPWNAVWLPIGGALHIDLGILLDPISVMMLVVISTVSLMVHIYSLGYMKGERGFQRYYAFLSLFTMSMIGLVVATNIFQMYLFWELVGVSSYLLIGFYYTKKEAVAASKKAFIVTRFADLGFLIGILIYGYYAGTFSFTPETHALVAADEHQSQRQRDHRPGGGQQPHLRRKGERPGVIAVEEDSDEESQIGEARHDKGLLRRGDGLLLRIVEADQQIRADAHQLPEQVHLENIGRHHKSHHTHRKQRQERIVTLETPFTLHVAQRVDMHHQRDGRDHHEHHHRNRVQQDAHVDMQRTADRQPDRIPRNQRRERPGGIAPGHEVFERRAAAQQHHHPQHRRADEARRHGLELHAGQA